MVELKPSTEELVAFARDLARQHLQKMEGFYPFGVARSESHGNQINVGLDDADTWPLVAAWLKKKSLDQDVHALASCADHQMRREGALPPDDRGKRGCFSIHVEERDGPSLDVWQPYVLVEGAVAFEPEQRTEGVRQFFPQRGILGWLKNLRTSRVRLD